MHFVYKTDSLIRSIRVSSGTRLLQRDFIFLNLFELHSFSVFKMNHWKPHHQFTALSDYICYFSCIYWLFWAMRPRNWNAFEMNSEMFQVGMLSSFHPHSMCEKVRGLRQKLDALRVQNGQSLSKYQGFIRKLVCYKGISFFELIWTP